MQRCPHFAKVLLILCAFCVTGCPPRNPPPMVHDCPLDVGCPIMSAWVEAQPMGIGRCTGSS